MGKSSLPSDLELTKVESTLRQLLLDVVAYIESTSGAGALDSTVQLPKELENAPLELRFAGGWVRDKLLGVGSHDIDIAINKMTGLNFAEKMQEYLKKPESVEKYGPDILRGIAKIERNPEKSKNLETATTKLLGLDLDFVNLRKETYKDDSRNPEVEFGTPEEDAMRRDATINSMFYNINTSSIEDLTGRGWEDMQAKIIRTPLEPYQTFMDDPLRTLRLIRFASRLNYSIDPDAENSMGNDDIKKAFALKISRERIWVELEKMLNGPDPHMAMVLINRVGLYDTIFTDPSRDLPSKPELSYFPSAYGTVFEMLSPEKADGTISSNLLRNPEEKFQAWMSAAVMPWADAPLVDPPKKNKPMLYVPQLVAWEGVKAPNRICDVITASLKNLEEIKNLKDQCVIQLRSPHRRKDGQDATARDTLGMAIRSWGQSWRSQLLFALLHDTALGSISKETILSTYSTFLTHLTKSNLLEVYAEKPIMTGTDLAKALSMKPGPWMKDALNVVMAWQLRHPDVTDRTEVIEAVKAHVDANSKSGSKPNQKTSELPARLATHFLQLTIRPLFASSQKNDLNNLTPAGHVSSRPPARKTVDFDEVAPWKAPSQAYAIDLLRWVLQALDPKGVEANWGLLIPPILRILDDLDTAWKAVGCELLTVLLKTTPPALLSRTGLGKVFEETLMPCLTYLPSLTPEAESVVLLDKTIPALMALADALYPPSQSTAAAPTSSSGNTKRPLTTPTPVTRSRYLDNLLRAAIFAPFAHSGTHVRIAEALFTHLIPLLNTMQLDAVKHLQRLLPMLSDTLSEPLGVAYPPLLEQAARAMQSVMLNAWPRISVHRGEVVRGLVVCWVRICESEELAEKGKVEGLEGVKRELKAAAEMLVKVVETDEEIDFKSEVSGLVEADERVRGLFDGFV
ncbi:tRNA nucleotidyltransferase [Lophium mytilinum]|uniref:tRNA nucleotidyltransferase n=1 Tax=Lophium mytilinum TaxID=390894 RepID=A0A6A6QY58_9PEZI|nr:tRNA nucleotidyltransferase [Lophium mytilinum]